jgi:ribosomal protein S18 acetylase RimI-like enzyme
MRIGEQREITIREAKEEDFAVIRELALASMVHRGSVSPIRDPAKAEAHMREYYTKLADQGLAYFPSALEVAAFIAVDESSIYPEPVGYVLVATNAKDDLTGERQAYILDIAVKPKCRGQGIGAELMRKAKEYAKGEGLRYIGLTVATGNKQALRLYHKLGYIEEWKRLAKRL